MAKVFFQTVLAMVISTQIAYARYDLPKVNDWKYHALMCKNAIIHLSIISQMDKKNSIAEVNKHQTSFKNMIKKRVLEDEKEYPFDSVDAELIADLVFAIREGLFLVSKNKPLEIGVVINEGYNICVSILDGMDKDLIK